MMSKVGKGEDDRAVVAKNDIGEKRRKMERGLRWFDRRCRGEEEGEEEEL